MSGLRVTKAGLLTQLQDRGRFGYGDIGITQSGVSDGYSAAWANRLLLNDKDAVVLEILLGGVSLITEIDTYISLTGAEAVLMINDIPKALWKVHAIKEGDRIEIGMAKRGLRLYLAVKGGFDCSLDLGSCSTTLKDEFGKKIETGEMLICNYSENSLLAATPFDMIPHYMDEITLRVVEGYQYDRFSSQQIDNFFSAIYLVTQAIDRMGCRLQGEPVIYTGDELISEPIAYGSIQIPPDGQPIIMLNERQTIGGYPKIGSVISMDCYLLAQSRPGTKVRFEEISLHRAIELTKETMNLN